MRKLGLVCVCKITVIWVNVGATLYEGVSAHPMLSALTSAKYTLVENAIGNVIVYALASVYEAL